MLNLRWREKLVGEANTFAFGIDERVILVSALVQRTDVSRQFDILLPCWLAGRDVEVPEYPWPTWPMFRMSDSCFEIVGVQFGTNYSDRMSVYLIEIPEMVANELARSVA